MLASRMDYIKDWLITSYLFTFNNDLDESQIEQTRAVIVYLKEGSALFTHFL